MRRSRLYFPGLAGFMLLRIIRPCRGRRLPDSWRHCGPIHGHRIISALPLLAAKIPNGFAGSATTPSARQSKRPCAQVRRSATRTPAGAYPYGEYKKITARFGVTQVSLKMSCTASWRHREEGMRRRWVHPAGDSAWVLRHPLRAGAAPRRSPSLEANSPRPGFTPSRPMRSNSSS